MLEFPRVVAQALADRPDLLMALMDRSGRMIWMNQTFAAYVNQPLETLVGQKFFQIFAENAQISPQHAYIREQLLKGESFRFEFVYQQPQQDPLWFLLDGQPIVQEDLIQQYVILASDITLRKQAELSLKQAKADLQQTNQALEVRVQQRTIDLIRAKEEAETALHQLQQTQTQLIQAEKMSSLGQLVAGVAHEINNPVNFIYGNIHHAEEYASDLLRLLHLYHHACPHPGAEVLEAVASVDLEFLQEDFPRLLKSIQVGADRIQEIVRSLRNFSRWDEGEMHPANLHEGLESTLMILHHRLEPKSNDPPIVVVQNYGELPLVSCYAGQLNQVFMNILSNAIDALRERDQTRSVAAIQTCPSTITIDTEALDDRWVAITIGDNGAGIPRQIQDKLFEPFFTTKPMGKGTGLGLSISYQIVVEKHSGNLTCQSHPDQGTSFRIELPIQPLDMEQQPQQTQEEPEGQYS